MRLKHWLLLTITFVTSISFSQERVIDRSNNVWISNINQYKINKNWFVSSEIHVRRTDGLNHWQQFLFRPGLNYRLSKTLELSIGYTFINSYPYGKQPIGINTPENNIWQQVLLKHNEGKWKFNHRFRLEERFIGSEEVINNEIAINGTSYSQRFRYRITLKRNITQHIFINAFDEIWINLANNFMPEGLNQNWIYGGVGYKLGLSTFQIGYMQQLIKKEDGVHFESNPTLQLTYGYKFGTKK